MYQLCLLQWFWIYAESVVLFLFHFVTQASFAISKVSRYPRGESEAINRRRTNHIMAKRKQTNNELQNTIQKIKDWATRIPLIQGCEFRCSGSVSSSCFIRHVVTTKQHDQLIWTSCWSPVYVNKYNCHRA